MRLIFAIISGLLFIIIDQTTPLSIWESTSVALLLYFLLDLIFLFGKRIVILHFFILLALLQWLIMPIFTYHLYNSSNYLAVLWVKTMEIPADLYYPFVMPGVLAMVLGFKFPLKSPKYIHNPIQYINQTKVYLENKSSLGWVLFSIGLLSSGISLLSIQSLGNVFFLLSTLTYVGILYIYFSNFPYKSLVLALLIGIESLNALKSGMFGGSIFLFLIISILLSLQWNLKFGTKLISLMVGFVFIFLLQSVKSEYRASTWSGDNEANASTFGNILKDQIENNATLTSENNFFFLVLRFNNGWQIARTMKRVPEKFPFANGESIALSLAATAVPRFLWPNKPMSGGKANLERFWGESYGKTSMNISPIGEAYANFGAFGGIIFMFFFGLLLNWCVLQILFWVERHPSIICWFPAIFYSFFGIETDILGILNSFVKGVVFTYLFIRLFKAVTGKKL